MAIHRNSQKRYYDENSIYFVTIKIYNGYPYFKESLFCDLFIEEIRIGKQLKNFNLLGFCIIYNHVHLLLQPGEEYNISKVMQFLKRHFTRDVNYIINHPSEGDIRECRLRGGEYERFAELVKNHDEILKQLKIQFNQKHGFNQTTFPKFKWQKSFYDHMIRDERDFENKYIYTVYNFQKHNLPNDWQYTSLNYEEMFDTFLT